MPAQPQPASTQMSPGQANALARQQVLMNSLPMLQPIAAGSSTFVPSATPNFQVLVPSVGLARGVWVQVQATVLNASTTQNAVLTDFGAANVLSNITLTDLMSYQRINIPGWQLNILNSVKGSAGYAGQPFGDSLVRTTGINSPNNYGANGTVNSATGTINSGGANTGTINQWYYIPIAYSPKDLRGAIFAATTSAAIRIVLTPNATPVVASTADGTLAVYQSAGALTAGSVITSITINTWYDYLDQLPVARNGQPVLPLVDLSTMYELKTTLASNAITQGADNQIQIPNMRAFLSFMLLYVSAAAGTRAAGTDINYIARQTANITNIFKVPPAMLFAQIRARIGCDLPPGWYYLDSREQPVSTKQFGNQNIIVNPSTANAGAYLYFAWEAFAPLASVGQASSLTSAG